MEMIKSLLINNYKSIRELHLECARINVFVGEPNGGKSNILEALDLSYLPWMLNQNEGLSSDQADNIKDYFRVKKVADLFHLGEINTPISLRFHRKMDFMSLRFSGGATTFFELETQGHGITTFDNNFNPINRQFYASPIKPYRFKTDVTYSDVHNYLNFLQPPYGNNLSKVVEHNSSLRETIGSILSDYGIELNINRGTGEMLIQLPINKGVVYTLPWKAVADTLQRYLFYLAAIKHNDALVITLEEPEVHSFPRYISSIADEIIATNKCQFFIATHSPYLLNNLIENSPKNELAVFVCGYNKERFETTAKKLTENELAELLDYGVDIFFNIDRYADNRTEHRS